MKKRLIEICSIVLVLSVVLTSGFVFSFASEDHGAVLKSGYCGDPYSEEGIETSNWTLFEDGTLLISGTGTVFGDSFDMSRSLSNLTDEEKAGIVRIIIEEGITGIEDNSFMDYSNLVEAELPETLVSIGSQAFMHCYSLNAFIPASVENISEHSFMLIKGFTVDENNPYYSSDEYGVLFNKDKTELICLPSCNEITEYTVPDGVVKIHNTSQYNGNLVKISFPESLREISEGAFAMSGGLEAVNFSEGIEKIGDAAFSGCLFLKELTLPASLRELGMGAFTDCYQLDKITIKGNDTEFAESCVGVVSSAPADGVSEEEWLALAKKAFGFPDTNEYLSEFCASCEYKELAARDSTIICIHDDGENTAVSYAESYSIPVERMHFYGDWEYDWESLIRIRKCELCEVTETEALEKETEGDVEIIAPSAPDLDFDVEGIDKNGDTFVLVQNTIDENLGSEYEVLKVFDITLKNKDGVHVQPSGTVKVKLPLDWEKDGNYIVYRVNEDGTLTDMQAFRQGSHMVFDTDHFSIYVIVEEATAGEEPSTEEETTGSGNTQSGKKDVFGFLTKLINAVTVFFMRLLDLIGF